MYDGTANTLEEETPFREKLLSDFMEGIILGWASLGIIVIAYHWMV